MRTWTRSAVAHDCGQCGADIPAGAPLSVITFPQGTVRLYRCGECDGPAPEDLPPLTYNEAHTKARVGALVKLTNVDWSVFKARR